MKRDMDVIRQLLLVVEALHPGEWEVDKHFKIDEISRSAMREYVKLLNEANYTEINVSDYVSGGYSIHSARLTWQGHDFLETIRNDTVWEETKAVVGKTGGGMVISVVKSVATKLLTDLAMGQIP